MPNPKKSPPGPVGAHDRLRARAEGKILKPDEIAKLIERLEARLAQLRNSQEQFFIGLERRPPNLEREALKQEIDHAKQDVGRNTSLKFRVNALWNKYLSYERMWLRTEKEIEEGRYHRDVFKARLHAQSRAPHAGGISETTEPEQQLSAGDDDFEVTEEPDAPPPPPAHPAPSPTRDAFASARPNPVQGGGVSDERLRAVYQAYVSAKRQCKEPTAGLSFEQVAGKLRSQIPELLAKTNAKGVDFKVVIKDGKATLRAVTKE